MKLFFRKFGEGKPLFILHGLFGLSDNWTTVGKILSKNFTVYLIDLRNHGSSPHSDAWTYPEMANDIRELMDDVLKTEQTNKRIPIDIRKHSNSEPSTIHHPPSIILMGHSLGGKVAMQFASMYPEKLEKLIVIDIAPKDYPVNYRSLIDNLLALDMEKLKSRKDTVEKISLFVKEPEVRQLLSKNLYWKEKSGNGSGNPKDSSRSVLDWKFNLKAISENVLTIEKTFAIKNGIPVSTLFIEGEKSNHIQKNDIPVIKKIFPMAEFRTVNDAGHWVHAENPEKFLECVGEFVK